MGWGQKIKKQEKNNENINWWMKMQYLSLILKNYVTKKTPQVI
jgi:hypothetical protein